MTTTTTPTTRTYTPQEAGVILCHTGEHIAQLCKRYKDTDGKLGIPGHYDEQTKRWSIREEDVMAYREAHPVPEDYTDTAPDLAVYARVEDLAKEFNVSKGLISGRMTRTKRRTVSYLGRRYFHRGEGFSSCPLAHREWV